MLISLLAVHIYTGPGGVILDIVALAVLGGNVSAGARLGVVRRLLAFLGAYLGTLAAGASGNRIMQAFHGTDSDVAANAWAFLGIFVLIILLFEFFGALWGERLHKLAELVLDRTLGALLGLVLGVFELGIVAVVAIGVAGSQPAPGRAVPSDPGAAVSSMDNSILFSLVKAVAPNVKAAAQPVLPSEGDMTLHFAGGSAGGR